MKTDILGIVMGVFVFLGTAFSIGSVSWCETAKFTLAGPKARKINFGLWKYNSYQFITNVNTGEIWQVETCNSYPDGTEKDSHWKAAQAFSIIAPIWGAFAFCPILAASKSPIMAKISGVLLLLACLFQGLTLLFLKSNLCNARTNPFFGSSILQSTGLVSLTTEEQCEVGRSAIVGIVAMCLWFLGGILAIVTPVEPVPDY
ncbi:expressed unknown protein [Seminavis robusta]|uniref:Uncharacterized protein n=1 Tax=Seminavis robusta TaxID=568900 RepID=A0A9N8DZR4_9STRA|nr:expressed unknown protein [Seminavis robusta]|eukprot:Sro478_g150930.1 n/a (202) ;mRNA; r:8332-9023